MLNKVLLIGHLGGDPELRDAGGSSVAGFSVATTERWKDKSGEKQERTEWHKIVAWRQLGELCSKYLRKGSKVYVEGEIQTRKWQDKDGNDRWTTEIIAREVKFLDSKGERDRSGPSGYSSDEDTPF